MSNEFNNKPMNESNGNINNNSDSSSNYINMNAGEESIGSNLYENKNKQDIDYTPNNNKIDNVYGNNNSNENFNSSFSYSQSTANSNTSAINNSQCTQNNMNSNANQDNMSNNANQDNMSNNANQNNVGAYSDFQNTRDNFSYNNTVSSNPPKVKKKHTKAKKVFATIAAMLVVSLASGSAGAYIVANHYDNTVSEHLTSENNNFQNISLDISKDSYYAVAVYEKNKDTVVGIKTTIVQKYESFFGGIQEREAQSIGSGVMIDKNGMILTNSHVIGDGYAKNVTVTLFDGSTEEAEVLWYDTSLDLAVIKIDKTDHPYATLGNSDAVLVGEPVVAMGNPMSLDLYGTTTNGIISGLNRSITVDGKVIKPLIQTSASINPGNSGGPLFNAKGEVIGINTAKLTDAEGIGFSIPINTVTSIINQLTNTGKVSSLYFGVVGTSVENYESMLGIQLSADSGFYISEVSKNSPAKNAGLTAGDIIIAVDDTKIQSADDLKRVLYNYKENDTATITYIRDGEENKTELTFKENPDAKN